MANDIQLVAYPATDLAKAKKFFSTFLGTEPYVDAEYYVGYKTDDGHEIGLDPNGKTVIAYVNTEDIEASLKELQDTGAEVVMQPTDVGGGLTIAQASLDGNVVGLRQLAK